MVLRRWLKIGVGLAATITTILGLFGLLSLLYEFEIVDLTGNFVCEGTYENPCISEFEVRNPNAYVVDIYSSDQVKLDFLPEIEDYALFVPDGRCSATGKCACELKNGSLLGFEDWRCVDFTNKTKPRKDRVYNFRFPAYSTTKFRLAGIKKSNFDTIKWAFGTEGKELDPIWAGEMNYTIKDNLIYLNNSEIYASAPYNISNGWAEFELTSKAYGGDIQTVWLVDTEEFDFIKPQFYNPVEEIQTISYSCDNFTYTLSPQYFVCHYPNGSIEYEGYFEWGDLKNKTAYWNVSYIQNWHDFPQGKFEVLHFEEGSAVRNFTGMDKGYFLNTSINANQTYRVRAYVDVPRENGFNLKPISVKYWWAFKPTVWSWQDTLYKGFYIDPWVDSSSVDQGLDYLDTNLVAYWKLDGNLIDNYLGLYNGTAITGSPTGSPTGLINGSMHFDGNDIANLTDIDSMESVSAITINFWVNDTFTVNYEIPFRKESSTGIVYAFFGRISVATNSLTVQFDTSAGLAYTQSQSFPGSAADWKMITFTYDGSDIYNYVNGVLNDSDTQTGTVDNSAEPFCLGGKCAYGGGYANYFTGNIDELGMWNRSMNSTEVLDLYNSGAGVSYVPAIAGDTTFPEINATYPTNITYGVFQTEFNYTFTEENPETCWWTNNTGDSNTTITCGTNVTGMNSSEGSNTWKISINDTAGNENSSAIAFFVRPPPGVEIYSPLNATYTTSTILFEISRTLYDIQAAGDCSYSLNAGNTNTTMSQLGTNFTHTNSSVATGSVTMNAYCNETTGGVTTNNNTESVIFYVSPGGTCTYSSGNWAIDAADNCVISSNVTIDTAANVTCTGDGSFTVNNGVWIMNWYKRHFEDGCYYKALGNGGFFQ